MTTTTTEGQFQIGNVSCYTKTWTPSAPPKAKLILVHGFSDHVNRYNDFFPRLTRHGIQVLGWDQRGWGRTVTKPSERGLTGPTARVLSDMAAFINSHLPSAVPVFVMGHSMGGGQLLTMAGQAAYQPLMAQLRGIILESPLAGFSKGAEPPALKVVLGRLAAKVLPRQQLTHEIPPELLTRRPEVVESLRKDALCPNVGTLEGLAALLDRTGALQGGEVRLGEGVRSVLVAHGTRDQTCSFESARGFLEGQGQVEDRVFKAYEGAYHQLHADLCDEEFGEDLAAWILERCEVGDAKGETDEGGRIDAKL